MSGRSAAGPPPPPAHAPGGTSSGGRRRQSEERRARGRGRLPAGRPIPVPLGKGQGAPVVPPSFPLAGGAPMGPWLPRTARPKQRDREPAQRRWDVTSPCHATCLATPFPPPRWYVPPNAPRRRTRRGVVRPVGGEGSGSGVLRTAPGPRRGCAERRALFAPARRGSWSQPGRPARRGAARSRRGAPARAGSWWPRARAWARCSPLREAPLPPGRFCRELPSLPALTARAGGTHRVEKVGEGQRCDPQLVRTAPAEEN